MRNVARLATLFIDEDLLNRSCFPCSEHIDEGLPSLQLFICDSVKTEETCHLSTFSSSYVYIDILFLNTESWQSICVLSYYLKISLTNSNFQNSECSFWFFTVFHYGLSRCANIFKAGPLEAQKLKFLELLTFCSYIMCAVVIDMSLIIFYNVLDINCILFYFIFIFYQTGI